MEVKDLAFALCKGMTIEQLEDWKRRGNENVKQHTHMNDEPCIVTLFNDIIDLHIRALQIGENPAILHQRENVRIQNSGRNPELP